MGKRIFLFLVTNLAIVLTLSVVVSVLGVAGGPDIGSLAVFCLVWGMGGAFISLQMSRWIAKRATGVHLIDGRTGDSQLDWLYQTVERLTRQANLPMPEVGVYNSGEVNAFATGPSKSRSLVAVSAGLQPIRGLALTGSARIGNVVAAPAITADTAQEVSDYEAAIGFERARLGLRLALSRTAAFNPFGYAEFPRIVSIGPVPETE